MKYLVVLIETNWDVGCCSSNTFCRIQLESRRNPIQTMGDLLICTKYVISEQRLDCLLAGGLGFISRLIESFLKCCSLRDSCSGLLWSCSGVALDCPSWSWSPTHIKDWPNFFLRILAAAATLSKIQINEMTFFQKRLQKRYNVIMGLLNIYFHLTHCWFSNNTDQVKNDIDIVTVAHRSRWMG